MTTEDNLAGLGKRGEEPRVIEDDRETILGLAFIGTTLSVIGIAFAVIGPFRLDGISLELLGMMLGVLGYCSGLQRKSVSGQVLGILTVAVCLSSVFISGMTTPPPQDIPLPGISSAAAPSSQ